jgi:hypothetical protein
MMIVLTQDTRATPESNLIKVYGTLAHELQEEPTILLAVMMLTLIKGPTKQLTVYSTDQANSHSQTQQQSTTCPRRSTCCCQDDSNSEEHDSYFVGTIYHEDIHDRVCWGNNLKLKFQEPSFLKPSVFMVTDY